MTILNNSIKSFCKNLKYSKTPSQMSSDAHKHVYYCMHAFACSNKHQSTFLLILHTKSSKIGKNIEKFITRKIFVIEHSAWRQMKENYQIYLPYQFHRRPQSAGWVPRFPHKKMKTMFLSNMSKSRRLTLTFSRQTRLPRVKIGPWNCKFIALTMKSSQTWVMILRVFSDHILILKIFGF